LSLALYSSIKSSILLSFKSIFLIISAFTYTKVIYRGSFGTYCNSTFLFGLCLINFEILVILLLRADLVSNFIIGEGEVLRDSSVSRMTLNETVQFLGKKFS
jgi:hypothetical protein